MTRNSGPSALDPRWPPSVAASSPSAIQAALAAERYGRRTKRYGGQYGVALPPARGI